MINACEEFSWGTSNIASHIISSARYTHTWASYFQAQTSDKRGTVEHFLLSHIHHTKPEDSQQRGYGPCFGLLRTSGIVPSPGLLDLVRMVVEPEHVLHFNPFLSDQACGRFIRAVSVWLQLCVLEDRLERLEALVKLGKEFEPILLRVRG